jgi:hypothetical protein
MTISYTAATVSTVTLTPQSMIVADATNELLVSFNVGAFDLTAAFKILMVFPDRFNSNNAYFPTGSFTCRNGTSTIAAAPTCSSTSSSGVSTVTVSNLYISTITSASTASFYIANIKNPISTATVSGITFQIVDATDNTYLIATKSSITMAVTTARTISSFTITFIRSTIGVLSTAVMTMAITPGVSIQAGCRFTVTYPTEITFQSATASFGIISSFSYTSANTSIGNIADNQCALTDSTTTVMNLITSVQGPPQDKDTSNFVFTLKTSAGADIATGTAFVPASSIAPGSITTFVFSHVSTGTTVVQETTEWKLGFTLANPLANPWVIILTYPSGEFTISACVPVNGIGFTVASTSCSVVGNIITIGGAYVLSAGAVSFEGVTGTNPTAVFDTGAFTVNSYNTISSVNYQVDTYLISDTSFTNPFQATAQVLTSITVSIDTPGTNSITGKTDVQYNFSVVHKSNFASGAILKLTIPTAACLTMYDSGDVSVSVLTFPTLITSAKSNATALTFTYAKFTNPRSTNAACGTFTISITNAAGYDLESGSGGSITVLTANTLTTFQITASPTSLTNGQTAAYAISSQANSNTALIAGDRMIMTFPSDIDVSGVTCTNCASDSGNIIYTVPSTPTNPLTFTLSNVVVQFSTTPISTAVIVNLATASSSSQQISVHSTTTVPTTITAGAMTDQGLTQVSQVAAAVNTYTFTFTIANKIPAGGVINIINTPGLTFTFDALIGCGIASGSFDACTFVSSINGVQIGVNTQITKSTAISISIANYTNPSSPIGTSFTVRTFTTSARTFGIDTIATGIVPSLECDYPCKTCSVTNPATCLSCFTTISSITEKFYISTSNTCVSSCPTSFSQDNTLFTCTACDSNCLTCAAEGATTTCLTCSSSMFLYNSFCYNACSDTPVTTYTSGTTCIACDST